MRDRADLPLKLMNVSKRNPNVRCTPKSLFLSLLIGFASLCRAQTDLVVVDEGLNSTWQDWSNVSTFYFATNPVATGSISCRLTGNPYSIYRVGKWQLLDTAPYAKLRFSLHGGPTGGQILQLKADRNGVWSVAKRLPALQANAWKTFEYTLEELGVADTTQFRGFMLQEAGGVALKECYLDNVRLVQKPLPQNARVDINVNQPIRVLPEVMFGVNTGVFDQLLASAPSINRLKGIKPGVLRFPGQSDGYHWETNYSDGESSPWLVKFDDFINVLQQTGATANISTNFGTGTAAEAARWVNYANNIRGMNIHYWEVGNEPYHPSHPDNRPKPRDPKGYAQEFVQFWNQMKAADPTIKVGIPLVSEESSYAVYPENMVTNPVTGQSYYGWTPVVLSTLRSLGVTPDYVTIHRYEQAPGAEDDAFLIGRATNWSNEIGKLRKILNDYLGSAASSVKIYANENNSVYANPGKQTTSLVNALYYAISMGEAAKTEVIGSTWWNWRHSEPRYDFNNAASLYGWRQYGDYGMCSNASDPYPTYYAAKAVSSWATGGDTMVQASTGNPYVAAYGATRVDGQITLMIVNKLPTTQQSLTLYFTDQAVASNYKLSRYGIPNDIAAQTGSGDREVSVELLSGAGDGLTLSLPPYSISVYEFTPSLTISGSLNFNGLPKSRWPSSIQFDILDLDSGQKMGTATANVSAVGTYSFGFPLNPGDFRLQHKPDRFLSDSAPISVRHGSLGHVDFDFANGDITNDNSVDLFDYLFFSAHYDTVSTDLAFAAEADLNQDSAIDMFDYLILSEAYNRVGS